MRVATLGIALTLTLGAPLTVSAAEQSREEQVCQARASEQNITETMRETFLRECMAGERLNKKNEPSK